MELEPSAGDGCLAIFDKRPGEDNIALCTRALRAVVRVAEAIAGGRVTPTRMGLLLGRIIEARLGSRMAKFGASFSVANRLEELCGHFGTDFLMDREVARNCPALTSSPSLTAMANSKPSWTWTVSSSTILMTTMSAGCRKSANG